MPRIIVALATRSMARMKAPVRMSVISAASSSASVKRVLGLLGHKKIRIQDFHGTVQRDPQDRFWVVPTFHPSFLQRGAHNLIGTVIWDLQRADQILREGWAVDQPDLVCDPPLDWFTAWVDQNGKSHRLSEERGHPLIVYFYPRDDTPGCTTEACQFRDMTEQYADTFVEL